MALLLAAILLFLIALIVVVVLSDYLSGRTELFTHRNIFLGGMIYFQLWNAIPVLFDPAAERYALQDPIPAGQIYALWAVIFVVVYLLAYKRVGFVSKAVNVIRAPSTVPSSATIWGIIIFLVPIAFLLRRVPIPYVGVLASYSGLALASGAAGLAAWQWAPRLLNPLVAILAVPTFAAAVLIASIGEFSRRPMLSVILGFGWGMYYGRLRFVSPMKALPQYVGFGLVAALLISAFTMGQGEGGGRGIGGFRTLLNPGQAVRSLDYVTETYSTARYALWLIDANYEQDREFVVPTLLTVTYTFLMPVPRALWEDKPWTVSTYMADWSDQEGVQRGRSGVTQPAGVLGNSAAEGGTWTVPIYAVFLALMTRFFDQLTMRNPSHPLVAVGAATMLGQAFGLSRGETPVLAFSYIFGQLVAYFALLMLANIVEQLFGTGSMPQYRFDDQLDPDDWDPSDWDPDGWDDGYNDRPELAPRAAPAPA